MKNLLFLIVCFTGVNCKAQGYIPTNPKERLKTYKEFLGNCKVTMKTPNQYSQAYSQAGYCKDLEPDSAEPYKLMAICQFFMRGDCIDDVNMYFKLSHNRDTTLVKYRAMSYTQRIAQQGICTGCYDSAQKDLNELINVVHNYKYYHIRALLYEAMNMWLSPQDTLYRKRQLQDDSTYIKLYGKDSYYTTTQFHQ